MERYNRKSQTTDSRGKRYLDVDSIEWKDIHSTIRENQEYFDNDKMAHINKIIYGEYTDNAEVIPIIPMPITPFMVIAKSNYYNKATAIELAEGDLDIESILSFNNLKNELANTMVSKHLNEAGFLRIVAGKESRKLEFETVAGDDIVYNFRFTRVCAKLDVIEEDTFLYEFQELNHMTRQWERTEFIAGDFESIDWKELKKFKLNDTKMEPVQIKIKVGEDERTMTIISKNKIKACSIIPMFGTSKKVAKRSPFVDADLILNMLLGFGLANAPTSLMVKIWVRNAKNQGGIDMSDKLGAIADILDVVPLGTEEEMGTLKTGDLVSLKNFFDVFEAILSYLAQLDGIPKMALQKVNQVRDSGDSKQTDNKGSNIYRDFQLMKVDNFEDKVYSTINKLLGTSYKFKNIDKSTSLTMNSAEILNQMILATTNGFEDFVDAISKYQGISKKDARAKLDDIMKSREQYGELLVGTAGMPMDSGAIEGAGKKTDESTEKGTKKDKDETGK